MGFALASAVGGAAQSFGMLVAARAVQGAFGAMLAPAALSLLSTTFTEPSERAKAFGIFAAIAGSGASIGLLLGGVLTQSRTRRPICHGQTRRRCPPADPCPDCVWAVGVIASSLAGVLAQRAALEVDRAGRVEVLEDLSLPGHPNVLAIGDMIRIRQDDGSSIALPGLAPVAMQEGRHAARVVRDRLQGRPERRFCYHDKGNLATIGRASAVADIKHIRLSGLLAWITWLAVHLLYLIGFENRLLVLTRWAFGFIAHGRGARLITDTPRRPIADMPAPVTFLPAQPPRRDGRGEQAA